MDLNFGIWTFLTHNLNLFGLWCVSKPLKAHEELLVHILCSPQVSYGNYFTSQQFAARGDPDFGFINVKHLEKIPSAFGGHLVLHLSNASIKTRGALCLEASCRHKTTLTLTALQITIMLALCFTLGKC
jgi:hypothetical protein